MNEELQTIVSYGRLVLSVVALALMAWLFGEALMSRLKLRLKDGGQFALATTLGLVIIAQGLFVLGLLGLFQPLPILLALAAGFLLCRKTWQRLWAGDALERSIRTGPVLAGTALVAPMLLLALYPSSGFDATMYHLPFVQSFLAEGSLTFVPELRFPVFPQITEMLFLAVTVFGGLEAAKLTQLLVILLAARILWVWGCRFSPWVGLWAAALWLGTPLVVWLGSMAYVDATLSLAFVASLDTWDRWRRGEGDRWLWLAGVFLGMAAGVKYLGLFFCGALGVMTLRRGVRPAAVLTLAAVLVLAPWYLNVYLRTGNPVFPFYEAFFGASDWTSRESVRDGESLEASQMLTQRLVDIGSGLGYLVMVPWNALFERELFNRTAPLSPFLLLLAPLLPLSLLDARRRWLVLIPGVYGLFWLTTVRDLRFLVPVLPLIYLALTATIEPWLRSRLKPGAALALAALLVAPGPLYAVYKCFKRGPLPLTEVARAEYLTAQVPGFAAIHKLNTEHGSDYTLYSLGGDRLYAFAEGRFLGNRHGPYNHASALAAFERGVDLEAYLSELGAGYFLLSPVMPDPPGDPFFKGRFRLVHDGADGFRLYERLSPLVE